MLFFFQRDVIVNNQLHIVLIAVPLKGENRAGCVSWAGAE